MQQRLILRLPSLRQWAWFFLSLVLAIGFTGLFLADTSRADHPCDGAININCGFDTFYGAPPRQIPTGWNPFILSGDLTYMQDSDTFFGAPSLRMWSNGGTFLAGLWQQVKVAPGATYVASIGWYGPNDPPRFGRQLGLDPTGGTNPTAATVIWGREKWGPGRIGIYPDDNINVSAVAGGPVMTVFVKVNHNSSSGNNYIFLDALALKRSNAPAVQPVATATNPPPTATHPPPTAAPTQPPPIAPAPAPTSTPARIAQLSIAATHPLPTQRLATTQPLVVAQAVLPSPTTGLAHLVFETPTLPPTDTPAPIQTPVPTATDLPTQTALPTETAAPTAAPTGTPVPPTTTAVPTAAASLTPQPTRLPLPSPTPPLTSFLSAELLPGFSTGSAVGLGGGAMGLMVIGLVFARRRRG